MEQKHTPEPWFVNKNSSDCMDGKLSIEVDGDFFIAQVDECVAQEANARRIVACVNAMEGIDDNNTLFRRGSIGTVRKNIVTQQVKIENLTTQRDQLMAALECLFDSYKRLTDSGDAGNWWVEDTDEGKKALAAIAAVKGDK